MLPKTLLALVCPLLWHNAWNPCLSLKLFWYILQPNIYVMKCCYGWKLELVTPNTILSVAPLSNVMSNAYLAYFTYLATWIWQQGSMSCHMCSIAQPHGSCVNLCNTSAKEMKKVALLSNTCPHNHLPLSSI
jgi:hypothetical protein